MDLDRQLDARVARDECRLFRKRSQVRAYALLLYGSTFDAVVEATVQRSRPVILTALAAMLAFIPLTYSVFWGTLAYTLIGGTFGGTVLTLMFMRSAGRSSVGCATSDQACLSARIGPGCTDHGAGSSSLSASPSAAVSWILPGL